MRLPLAVWTTGQPVPRALERSGTFYDMIQRTVGAGWDGDWREWDATTAQPLPAPGTVAGVVITGSPARIGTRDAWMLRLEAQLRVFAESETPLLGICFGHQLLGSALGGKAEPNPLGREIGTQALTLCADDELLAGIHTEHEPRVAMSHLDSVTILPPGARRLASTGLEQNAAVRFGPSMWGVQFHPEMDARLIGDYLEDRRAAIESEGLDVDQLLRARVESDYGGEVLRRFALICGR